MNITSRKNKYKRGGKSSSYEKEKFLIPFDLESLNLFCAYVLSENKNIRKSSYINMRNLFSVIHEDSFKNDDEKIKRVNFIKKGLDARVIKNFTNPYLVMKYINGGLIEDNLLDPNNFMEVSNEERRWVDETISACVKNSFMNDYIERLKDFIIRYESTDYRNRTTLIPEFEMLIAEIQAHFRKIKVEDASEVMFSLNGQNFEDSIREIHSQLSNPGNKLVTGMRGLNEMLSGGFEQDHVYLFFALSGEGKTITLLNLAYQIKKYNKDYTTKDPTKKPCIVILSMENTVKQLVGSLFNIAVCTDDMKNYDVEEVIRLLKEEGELLLSNDSPIDIIIKFKPGMSVDTSYMYSLVEDLEDDGYECILMIQDYIKRIRPVDYTGDIRLDLGNVINDYKNFAAIKGIPVISASQLNRTATQKIDEGRKTNKADLLRLIGRDNIGESMLILENIDGGFMLAPEYDKDGNKYFGFQRIKARYKKNSNRESFYHPCVANNPIKFVEDENAVEPAFKESLRADKEQFNKVFGNANNMSHIGNTIKEIDDGIKLIDSTDNLFANASASYNKIAFTMPKMPIIKPKLPKAVIYHANAN